MFNTVAVSQLNCVSSSAKLGAMSTRSASSAVSLRPPSFGQALHRCLQVLLSNTRLRNTMAVLRRIARC